MKKLEPAETRLVSGKFKDDRPELYADEKERLFALASKELIIDRDVWDRINWLTEKNLKLIGIEKVGGWEKLYRDTADGRFWMLTYPFGELQGGGPPSLICMQLGDSEIKAKFVSPAEWDAHMEKYMRDHNIRIINPDKKKKS